MKQAKAVAAPNVATQLAPRRQTERVEQTSEAYDALDSRSQDSIGALQMELARAPVTRRLASLQRRVNHGMAGGETLQKAVYPDAPPRALDTVRATYRKRVAQRQVVQRSPTHDFTTKFGGSSFQSADRSDQVIYALYTTADDLIGYVGKSNDAVRRFKEHKNYKDLGDDYDVDIAASGSWTPFETATHEQYYIGLCGGKDVLMNKINALTTAKWNWFKTPTGEDQNKKQNTKLTDGHF